MKKSGLVKEVCKREGKKSQVAVGNVREILGVLEDMYAEDYFEMGVRNVTAEEGLRVAEAMLPDVQKRLDKLWKKHDKEAKNEK